MNIEPPFFFIINFNVDSVFMLNSDKVLPDNNYLSSKINLYQSGGIPSLSYILSFKISTVSYESTSKEIVLPVGDFINIYIPIRSLIIKFKYESYLILYSSKVLLSSSYLPRKIKHYQSVLIPSLFYNLPFTSIILSDNFTSNIIVLPMRVLTYI